MKLVLLIAFVALQFGQAQARKISPDSAAAKTHSYIATIKRDISSPDLFNAQNCSSYIYNVTQTVRDIPTDFFRPRTPRDIVDLVKIGPQILKDLFSIRVALRERMIEFDQQNKLNQNCINAVRAAIRYVRFSEEFLLEWLVSRKVYANKITQILSPEAPYTMKNPKFSNTELKTGDLMIIRGKSYVSALIAQIGDEEAQFSHLAIVAEDSSGVKYVVEALIQKGVIVTPLNQWIKGEESRVSMYRLPDEILARKAGRKIYDYVVNKDKSGQHIKYDFAMDDSDYSRIFCAEVVRLAYDLASDGKFLVPKYRSQAKKFIGTDHFKKLGVKQYQLFAPADIEVDPRFEFVGEYRYLPLLRQVRMQDAVLFSVYNWMIEIDYHFKDSAMIKAKSVIGKTGRQFGFFKDKLPSYMPTSTLEYMLQVEVVAEALQKEIYAQESAYYSKTGHSYTFTDYMKIIENKRKQDCYLSKYSKATASPIDRLMMKSDKSEFHWIFNSTSQGCYY